MKSIISDYVLTLGAFVHRKGAVEKISVSTAIRTGNKKVPDFLENNLFIYLRIYLS